MQVVEKITINLGSMHFETNEEFEHFFQSFENIVRFYKYRFDQKKEGRIISFTGKLVSSSVHESETVYSSLQDYNYLKSQYEIFKFDYYREELGWTVTKHISYIYD